MNPRAYFFTFMNVLSCRSRHLLLAFCCFAGALIGTYASRFTGASFLLLTRMTLLSPVSVVGLAACCLLPFLFAAFAVFISCHWLLYLICFIDFFLYCWFGFSVMSVFGSAGWLIRLFLQFPGSCLLPVLCWFSLRHISGRSTLLKRDISLCFLMAFLTGVFYYCVIAPFLASLINI